MAALTEKRIREALAFKKGVKVAAAGALGVDVSTLTRHMKRLGIEFSRKRYSQEQIETALLDQDGNRSAAARSLGCTEQTMLRLIRQYGLENDFPAQQPLPDVSRAQLLKALKDNDWSRTRAARALGYAARNTVSRLIVRYNIETPPPVKDQYSRAKLLQLLRYKSSKDEVARTLGVSTSYLCKLLREHGIHTRRITNRPRWDRSQVAEALYLAEDKCEAARLLDVSVSAITKYKRRYSLGTGRSLLQFFEKSSRGYVKRSIISHKTYRDPTGKYYLGIDEKYLLTGHNGQIRTLSKFFLPEGTIENDDATVRDLYQQWGLTLQAFDEKIAEIFERPEPETVEPVYRAVLRLGALALGR